MSSINEITYTVNEVKKYNKRICLTQCTSVYPCPPSISDIGVISNFQKKFNLPIGLSDHTSSNYTSYADVALGAVLVEKHFTLDKTMSGPDHLSSINPKELKELVEGCNIIHSAKNDKKTIHKEERQIINWARESVVSKKEIRKGDFFKIENISVKRPAPKTNEIKPKYFFDIIGRKAKKHIKAHRKIKWSEVK